MTDSAFISAATLRARLAGTILSTDPTDVVMPPGSEQWPASMREQLAASLTPAGVLVPFIDRGIEGLSILFTQRSAELKHHAGQVSFPGGRMDPGDADIAATALRETYEEVGIARENIEIIAYLDPMPTVTGYAVTPVVALVDESIELKIDKTEVEYAFEVPLQFLLDRSNERMVEREIHGSKVPMIEFHYEGQRIWGSTAFIVFQLMKMIRN
ncbi:MAG: CoA pyrophosphatase [Proteobacteria bacterium]|nr:CoA pyrophosphatase [Pseudomonadota bacterium]